MPVARNDKPPRDLEENAVERKPVAGRVVRGSDAVPSFGDEWIDRHTGIAQKTRISAFVDAGIDDPLIRSQFRNISFRAFKHLNEMDPRPDLVIATGDLADDPNPEVYRVMRRMLDQIEMPVYVIPGNHDDREMLRAAFLDLGSLPVDDPFLQYTIEEYPLRMIGLDTLETDGDGGEMCASRLRWLDDRLSEQPDRPTLIFMHYQPLMTRMGYVNKNAFHGASEMEELIRGHSQVDWIICGHLHRPIQMR